MGANPDQEPKQPTWRFDVVLSDHTISFATGPDGAGRRSEEVHWRGDPESRQYNLSDTGIVAAAGSSLLRILATNSSELPDSFVRAVNDALSKLDEIAEPLANKPIVVKLREYCWSKEKVPHLIDRDQSLKLISNLSDAVSREVLAKCLEQIEKQLPGYMEIERLLGLMNFVGGTRPIKGLFTGPRPHESEYSEPRICPFNISKGLELFDSTADGSFFPEDFKYSFSSGRFPTCTDVLRRLCVKRKEGDPKEPADIDPAMHINRALALRVVGQSVVRDICEKLAQASLLESQYVPQMIQKALIGSALPAASAGIGIAFLLETSAARSWGWGLLCGGAVLLLRAVAPIVKYLTFGSPDESGGSLRKEAERIKGQHENDRRALLTEIVLRFIDHYTNPDMWDCLLGSKSAEIWHRSLFGREDFDLSSLVGRETHEGRVAYQPDIKLKSLGEYATSPSWISEEEELEIIEASRVEIVYSAHMATADRAIKQIFSIFVGYSFAQRQGLLRDADKPIEMLKTLLEVSQVECCDRDGNYPTIKNVFDEMLRELGLNQRQWETIAPAVIAVERLERSIMEDTGRRIAQEILVQHLAGSTGLLP
jgi:hypothetical protein